MGQEPNNGWEGEGDDCGPDLPHGYDAQPFWGFHDPAGRHAYELTRVYGPPTTLGARGPVQRLDEDRSYWSVTWRKLTPTGDERPAGRWLTYARARSLRPRLSFEAFSSMQMRDQLPGLLQVSPVAPVAGRPEPSTEPMPLVPARRPG